MRITLYGWLQYDPTLFDDVTLPDTFDKQYMIDEIIMRSGDLFTYHQQPAFLKRNITNWFNRNYEQFLRMMDALLKEYNPIENYDRTEDTTTTPGVTRTEAHTGTDTEAHTGTDKHYESGTDTEAASGTDTEAYSGTDTEAYSGTDTEAHSGTDGRNIKSYPTATRNTENQVSAYDSSVYSPKDKTIVTGSGYDESQDDLIHGESIGTTYGKSVGTTYGKSVGTTYGKSVGTTYGHKLDLTHGESIGTTHGHTITDSVTGYDTFHSRIHGNIGVTTNAQMVTQELELRKFDIYTDIARRFEKEFLIQIY
jgi:hypothetical protein